MEILEKTEHQILILCSKQEVELIEACLMHVQYEFAMGKEYNVEISIGRKKETIEVLQKKLESEREQPNSSEMTFALTNADVMLILQCLLDCIKYINTEFHTLIGYELPEARAIITFLKNIVY